MKFNEVATISGKAGLYKVLKPSRGGAILESLDEKKSKVVVGPNHRVSLLAEISIYTMTEEGASPLEDVMKKIHQEFNGDPGLDATADAEELRAFLKHVLPDFDQDKVYPSDIKKLVAWYKILSAHVPEVFAETSEDSPEERVAE